MPILMRKLLSEELCHAAKMCTKELRWKMMREIIGMYINRKVPGTQEETAETQYKEPGGPPKTKRRMKMRKEADAKGPAGCS